MLAFLGSGAFFCFFVGGVFDRRDWSSSEGPPSEFSSSEAGFARFFAAGLLAALVGLRVVCLVAALAFGAAGAFFAGALAF